MIFMKDKLDYKMLRKAKASELVAGGVWYRKDENGKFWIETNDLIWIPNLSGYRKFLKQLSIDGNLYLRADKPNYPLNLNMENYYKEKMEYYESISKKNNNS